MSRNWAIVLVLAWVTGCRTIAMAAEGPVRIGVLAAQPDAWFGTPAQQEAIDRVLSWQTPLGGWAKEYDAGRARVGDEPYGAYDGLATIDNGATYTELRLLARAHRLTPRADALAAFNRGLDFLLDWQYPSGGWSQRMPRTKKYPRMITFNDDAMINVLKLLQDVVHHPDFRFVDDARRTRAERAVRLGVECILKCQIVRDGVLTGWGAQHDPDTFEPTGARPFELPSLSGQEGANVALFLMSLDKPDARVRRAVHAAAAWFESVRIPGYRLIDERDENGKLILRLAKDPDGVTWARFYALDDQRPLFADWEARVYARYEDLPDERRNGYRWYGDWGLRVASEYTQWRARHGE
ncbi:MAG TPA: pectate lyase [Tepidisphaeraceae bacterium]|jgi:pectate lyase|nr:pectate lyase [Tepidisphaeraceae bacterium]